MNKLSKSILGTAIAIGAIAVSTQSQAVSSFARQTGLACSSCHFQHYPMLNEFGRAFKAGGFTMIGKEGKIEGSAGLSLPEVLNAGLVMKLRYQKTNGPKIPGTRTTNDGELQFPDEFALLLGGRVSENIGFLVEGQMPNHDDPFLANFKMPFMFDVRGVKAGVVAFTTDEQGAAYGFELMNTGAVHNIKMMEHRKDMSAQQYIGTDTKAEGAAFVIAGPKYFATLTKWSPNHVNSNNGTPSATYLRAAVTPKVGAWDLGAGFQSWRGSANTEVAGIAVPTDTKAWAVDAQAQGAIGSLPLGIYLSHAKAAASDQTLGATTNLFNGGPNSKSATAIAAGLGVLPGKVTLMFAFRKGKTGALTNSGDNSWTVGATYQIVQNLQLQVNHSRYSGSAYDPGQATMLPGGEGNRKTTIMLFGSF